MSNIKERLKEHFKEVIRIKKSPKSIALGFALGTLIAILPTFGLGIFIGLLIILIFKKINKISMIVAFAVWNPFVLAPMAALSYYLGDLILGSAPIVEYELTFMQNFFIYTRRFLLGNFILSTAISTISYFLVYYFTKKYQKRD